MFLFFLRNDLRNIFDYFVRNSSNSIEFKLSLFYRSLVFQKKLYSNKRHKNFGTFENAKENFKKIKKISRENLHGKAA